MVNQLSETRTIKHVFDRIMFESIIYGVSPESHENELFDESIQIYFIEDFIYLKRHACSSADRGDIFSTLNF